MLNAAPVMADELDDVLARARGGDPAAFGDIVRRYQGMVFSLALHYLRDRAAAEDLAQDVFLELFRSLGQLVSPAHVKFWLRRVASHRCIDTMRRRSHQAELKVERMPEPAVRPANGDPLLKDRLQRLIAALPPHPRMVMILKYQEDLEPSEIAAVLSMPVNTVKSHLRRSIEYLRAQLSFGGIA